MSLDIIDKILVNGMMASNEQLRAERDRARDRCVLLDSTLAEIARLMGEEAQLTRSLRVQQALALAEGDEPPARVVQAAKDAYRERNIARGGGEPA